MSCPGSHLVQAVGSLTESADSALTNGDPHNRHGEGRPYPRPPSGDVPRELRRHHARSERSLPSPRSPNRQRGAEFRRHRLASGAAPSVHRGHGPVAALPLAALDRHRSRGSPRSASGQLHRREPARCRARRGRCLRQAATARTHQIRQTCARLPDPGGLAPSHGVRAVGYRRAPLMTSA